SQKKKNERFAVFIFTVALGTEVYINISLFYSLVCELSGWFGILTDYCRDHSFQDNVHHMIVIVLTHRDEVTAGRLERFPVSYSSAFKSTLIFIATIRSSREGCRYSFQTANGERLYGPYPSRACTRRSYE
ncbi:hypothetical protein M758_6G192600, partial [Ceratodon purpureus]